MTAPPTDGPLDWLIVGGGIHGTHLAVRLLDEGLVEPQRLRLVDPAPRLLARWRECAAVTGMRYLRSPSVHHIDSNAFSLRRFVRRKEPDHPGRYAQPYDRPALDLFDAHCEHVIERAGLADLHLRDRVVECAPHAEGNRVRLAGGASLEAGRMVLALGTGEQPSWPDWAPRQHPRVQHVFAPGFDDWPEAAGQRVAVLGGGITGAQVATRLAEAGQHVELVARHGLRESPFDIEPGWLGPKLMHVFSGTPDLARRRRLVRESRQRGSMPADSRRALQRVIARGQVSRHECEVDGLDSASDALVLRLANGRGLEVDQLLLATGFETCRPGGPLVDGLVEQHGLPVAPCGYPIVDAALRWHPRLHVTGPLAELEIGPASRNIAGGRRAAERILASVPVLTG